METKISSKKISSFAGDILPVWLSCDGDAVCPDVKWSVSGDAAHIRVYERKEEEFEGEARLHGFLGGVLVTLDKVGAAEITAEYEGKKFICEVEVRDAVHTESGRMSYYTADLHNHTTMIHRHDELCKRCGDFQSDYVKYLKDADDIDLSVISDHADVIDGKEFFMGFVDVCAAQPMNTVILPGAESEITLIETDRFGQSHKNAGEIVTLCADNFAPVTTHAEFFEKMSTSPHIISILAHPQVLGFDRNGIWNFCLDKHRDDGFRDMVKLVEMGDARVEDRDDDIINEFIYSVALDNGYRVSTTCSSDRHEAPWGRAACGGKTIVMAPERSKEAFIDALRSCRCYCSDSGNLKLYCEVNGRAVPCDLEPCGKYNFHVEVDYFEKDDSTVPVKCAVISDYGKCVKEISGVDFSAFDFEVESDTARWFYLRFEDSKHRKTLSPPVFCGREYDEVPMCEPSPIDKSGFEARELISDTDASLIINDDPCTAWISDKGQAELLIDMKSDRTVSALGHYPYRLLRQKDPNAAEIVASFAGEYEVSLSSDGKSFKTVAEGAVRVYGGEVIIRFEKQKARYVKFTVRSTAGKMTGYPKYANTGLRIGELTVFE